MAIYEYEITGRIRIDADSNAHLREALNALLDKLSRKPGLVGTNYKMLGLSPDTTSVPWEEIVGYDELHQCGRCGHYMLTEEVSDCYECCEVEGRGCDQNDSVAFCSETCWGAHVDQYHPHYGEK